MHRPRPNPQPRRGAPVNWFSNQLAIPLSLTVLLLAQSPPWANLNAAPPPLDWQTSPAGYRFALAAPAEAADGTSGFLQLSPANTGITFINQLSPEIAANNQILANGAGVALGDIDGDGWCDIYLCGSENPNRLYRNLGGFKFMDITDQAGVACPNQFSTGAALADVDNDGDLDLAVNGYGVGTRLFHNNGKGQFTEAANTGLSRTAAATSMTFADIEGDGDLDLYVTHYRTESIRNAPPGSLNIQARMVGGRLVVTPSDRFTGLLRSDGSVEVIEKAEADALYLNDGRGRFTAQSWTGGRFLDEHGAPLKAAPQDWGLSAMFRDINDDGAPDLYVCNDFFFSPDHFWINDGKGNFRAMPSLAWRKMSLSSMAVDFADINRDGFDDFLVVEMLGRSHADRQRQRGNALHPKIELPIHDPAYQPEAPRNTLFLNRGDATFAEIAWFSALAATDWSWSAAFVDVDLDGFEDLLVTTGNLHDVLDADALAALAAGDGNAPGLPRFPTLPQTSLAFRNLGNLSFREHGRAWGFNPTGFSHGLALADLDNDGDLDVVLNHLGQAAGIYQNRAAAPRIAVRLNGTHNRRGIGAKLIVTGGPVSQSQTMAAGGRYLSSDDPIRAFAAGSPSNRLNLIVRWREGRESHLPNLLPNHIYEVDEHAASPPTATNNLASGIAPAPPRPLFKDESAHLNHRHVEAPFPDFIRQPLLPYRLSQLGPGLAIADLNADGWDDLAIASGRGGRMGILTNTGAGSFVLDANFPANLPMPRDQTALLSWPRPNQGPVLLAGASTYEDNAPSAVPFRLFDLRSQVAHDPTPPTPEFPASAGPMAMADIDGDGDLDLFVGGRVIPGKYPEPPPSALYRNHEQQLLPDPLHNFLFSRLGLVSGAAFSDIDNDGDPDLILACEWDAIRVFINQNGTLEDATTEFGLAPFRGLWRGVAAGDFDNDGRMDFVASNLGRNSPIQPAPDRPHWLYYGQFNGDQTPTLLEAFYDPALRQLVPAQPLDKLLPTFPSLAQRFPAYRSFSRANVQEILGEHWPSAKSLRITTADSTLFLNRGRKFEPRPLPDEAQFSPAFGLAVADFDGDGNEDIFLAQNLFGVQSEASRHDAGRGLLLRGDGQGRFTVLSSRQSGISIHGEQRGAAVADFNQDGRADLVVTQRGETTKLFFNQASRPGLRVRLIGPDQNPHAVGAQLGLRFHDTFGPVREIRSGGGYWSQDSPVPVMALPQSVETSVALWVRWPGGQTNLFPVAPGTREISVSQQAAAEIQSQPPPRP